MNTSSVVKVFLALSIMLNLALIGFLLWARFMPFNQRWQDDEGPAQVKQGNPVNGKPSIYDTTSPVTHEQPPPNRDNTVPTETPSYAYCGEEGSVKLTPPDHVNIFKDLTAEEIIAAEKFLLAKTYLKLVQPRRARMKSNFIFSIELQTPNKSAALQYLDNKGELPPREAKVVMFLPGFNPSMVAEYVVGPLPNPTYHYRNPRRDKAIDYRVRQFNGIEMGHAIKVVRKAMGHRVEDFLKKNFGAHFFDCGSTCLTFTSSAVSSSFSEDRKLWINAMYQVEFTTLHMVGFQFLLNMKTLDPSNWFIEMVWYAGKAYTSFDVLLNKYESGQAPKLNLRFPDVANTKQGTLNIKGKQFPEVSQAGPRQYEPQGHRYTIKDQHVEYLQQWRFDYRMSYAGAIQLYDIRFGGDRIAYEASLQEVSVLYAGANPATMHSQLADSAFGLSRSAHGLVPGLDCPDHATFLPALLFGADNSVPLNYPNSVCIFEHNSGVPARRHMARSHRSGFFYQGLVDTFLVVRTIFVMYNYDYILDFIFHQNGAMEIKVYSTGYILTSYDTDDEMPFGFRVFENTIGSIHHHMFNFKLDVDVLGTSNRYETLNFVVDNNTRSWYDDLKPFPQLAFERDVRRTEKQAAYKYNFDTPKYHIFTNNYKANKFSEIRGYRLEARGFTKQMLPEDLGALHSYAWARYQIAITKRKDEEETSSSMHAIFDSADPVVSLQRYIDDDEDIVDQDLVAWVTLGMLHIPHSEDVPNTPTTGTEASILLLPYNYFEECPSMGARDAVRVNGSFQLDVNRHGIPHEFNCIPNHLNIEDFKKEKNHIFMSLG